MITGALLKGGYTYIFFHQQKMQDTDSEWSPTTVLLPINRHTRAWYSHTSYMEYSELFGGIKKFGGLDFNLAVALHNHEQLCSHARTLPSCSASKPSSNQSCEFVLMSYGGGLVRCWMTFVYAVYFLIRARSSALLWHHRLSLLNTRVHFFFSYFSKNTETFCRTAHPSQVLVQRHLKSGRPSTNLKAPGHAWPTTQRTQT